MKQTLKTIILIMPIFKKLSRRIPKIAFHQEYTSAAARLCKI